MGQFSQEMRKVAVELIRELGNDCVMTKIDRGAYDPALGKTVDTRVDFKTFSGPVSAFNRVFTQTGENTNLAGFDDETVVVGWFGEEVDETWECDGAAISSVRPIRSQNDIIAFTITLHKGP